MILRHRDRELLRFEWNGLEGVRIVSVNEAEKQFLPLEIRDRINDETLWAWLASRTVPRGRKYIHRALLMMGLNPRNIPRTIEFSRGLSLNDVYWVVEDGFDGAWKDYNLYDNEFSEEIAFLALTGLGYPPVTKHASTPEFSTNGMLRKCWRRVKGEVQLFKGGTEGAVNTGFEPYSEYYAAQVAEALGLPHVAYGLSKYKKVLCSTCPLFTSEKYRYIPAGHIVSGESALNDPRFSDIFFFDALIFNTDRHLGNFGFLIDNDTNEIAGAAPIFDNGYGLFSLAVDRPDMPQEHEFDDLRKFLKRVSPALYETWLGFPGGLTNQMRERLEGLRGFHFKRHHYYNLPDERYEKVEDFLQKRILNLLEYGNKADEFLKISNESDSIISTNKVLSGGLKDRITQDSLGLQIKQNLKADPFITREELKEILQVSMSSIDRKLKELQESGEICREGSRKKGSWKVLK